ncbi:MAG: hypothetical protein ACYTX0_47190, partial [Nostoc sp.]
HPLLSDIHKLIIFSQLIYGYCICQYLYITFPNKNQVQLNLNPIKLCFISPLLTKERGWGASALRIFPRHLLYAGKPVHRSGSPL